MGRGVSSRERTVRIALGALLALVSIAGFGNAVDLPFVGIVVAAVVGLLLVTGVTRTCPASAVLGVRFSRWEVDELVTDSAALAINCIVLFSQYLWSRSEYLVL